jgi:hypothetical protein
MRSNQPRLGETTIKVPAPFAGIEDLGFTAQYRAQGFNEPLRDVPLLFEGPPSPMGRLAELLRLLGSVQANYAWTGPVMLSEEVAVMAFRDNSLPGAMADRTKLAGHLANLVRPVVFTFLRDCATIADLRLAELIELRVTAERSASVEMTVPLGDIVKPNGEILLWS